MNWFIENVEQISDGLNSLVLIYWFLLTRYLLKNREDIISDRTVWWP